MIGFCFLVIDDLPHHKIWAKYLKGSPHVAIVHSKFMPMKHKPSDFCQTKLSGVLQPEHGDIRCVMALIELLKEGLQANEEISHFIFLSETCLPVVPLQTLEQELDAIGGKSIIHFSHPCPRSEHGARYNFVDTSLLPHLFSQEDWIFHPTWIVVSRPHAHLLVQSKQLQTFYRAFQRVPFVDEHFIGTVLYSILGKQQFSNQIDTSEKTFANWKEYERTPDGKIHPKTYRKWDPALNTKSSRYWFVRKVKCEVQWGDLFNGRKPREMPIWCIILIVLAVMLVLALVIFMACKRSGTFPCVREKTGFTFPKHNHGVSTPTP